MNLKELQKRIILRSAIVVGALVILGGGVFGIMSLDENSVQEQGKLKSQLDGTNAKSRDLQTKIVTAKESLSLYDAIKSRGENEALLIDRADAKRRLDKMKDEYQLNSINLTMTPIANEPGGAGGIQLVSTSVKLTVEALSDEIILAFINGIKLEFPGYVRLERFVLKRKNDLTRDALIDITRGKLASLVEAQIDFKWLGVKAGEPNPSSNSSNPATVNLPGAPVSPPGGTVNAPVPNPIPGAP